MSNTASPSVPRRVLWAAMIGLVAVPAAAIGFVVLGGEPDKQERRRDVRRAEPTAARPAPEPPESEDPAPERPSPRATAVPRGTKVAQASAGTPASEVAASKIAEARRVENTDPALARKLLREAIAVDPTNAVALRSLSTKLLIDENMAEARDYASRCMQVTGGDPDCAKVNEYATEDVPEVEDMARGAEQCIKDTPGNVLCLAGLVNYHLMRGNPAEAAVYAGRVSQMDPNSSVSQFVHGRVRAATGNYAGAKEMFELACRQGEQQSCFRSSLLQQEGF